MTRLAVLSDIHGNLPALEAVAADMRAFAPDHVVVCGDLVNPMPYSREVLEWVLDARWGVIRGNHEIYLVDGGTDRQLAKWHDYPLGALQEQVGAALRTVVAGWPDTLSVRPPDAPPLRVVHGTFRDVFVSVDPQTPQDEALAHYQGVDERTVIAGHNHLPMDRRVGPFHALNPGSVGTPLDGDTRASYMILDGNATGWRAHLRRVAYDVSAATGPMRADAYLAARGFLAEAVATEVETARCVTSPFRRWLAAHHPTKPPTLSLLSTFIETVDMRAWQNPKFLTENLMPLPTNQPLPPSHGA